MQAGSKADALPKLRILMGGAMGLAFAPGAAEAQSGASAPAPAAADAAIQLPTIEVGGEARNSGYQTSLPSLSKFTGSLNDTPQSISVVPRQLIEDQAIVNTRDALRNVPGISLGAGEGGSQGDNLTLRGFSARNDIYLDGMRDFGSYTRDPFDLESIEVLKGPSSVAFGRGSTGGVVNQVSKQPGLAPITAGSITFGTDGTKRITTDVNRAITALPGAAVRLNFMADESGVADRNADQYRRFAFAPSVAFGIGTPTRFALNYLHQQEYNTPDYGLPWLYNSPASVPRQNFYGYKDSDYYRTNVDIVTAKFEHDFSKDVTIRNQFRYGNYYRDIRVTEPQIAYTGAGPAVTRNTPLGNILVNRNSIAAKSTETFLQNQTDLTVRFATGPVQHALVAGIEAGQETSSPARFTYAGNTRANLLNPNMDNLFLGRATTTADAATRVNGAAVYAIDTMKFLEKFDLTVGVRYDYLDTKYDQNVAPAVHLSRTDSIPSTRFALGYHPVPAGTLYVAYGTSFNPSADSLTLATNNAGLAPEENETYEVGAKWEVLDRRLTLSTALFHLEKTNARVTDPNNALFQILGGDQRVQGIEFGVIGNITDRWQISAGYAYLDSRTVKTTLALTQGQALANTPKHSGSVFTTYRLPWRDIQLGAGINGLSSRLASSSPDTTTGAYKVAGGYITAQAMVKVPLREGLDLQLNGYNLTNQKYYDLLHPSHVVPGAGRSLLASLNFKL
jgi:catecholate siderophore receptor